MIRSLCIQRSLLLWPRKDIWPLVTPYIAHAKAFRKPSLSSYRSNSRIGEFRLFSFADRFDNDAPHRQLIASSISSNFNSGWNIKVFNEPILNSNFPPRRTVEYAGYNEKTCSSGIKTYSLFGKSNHAFLKQPALITARSYSTGKKHTHSPAATDLASSRSDPLSSKSNNSEKLTSNFESPSSNSASNSASISGAKSASDSSYASKSASGKPGLRRTAKTLDYHLKNVKSQWGRLAVRTKWALIKNYRPFNTDEIGAMFSWIIWGHILWVLLGTTTFISLLIWAMSQSGAQDAVARWVGRLVTKETGLRVVFEQAILPDWKSGAIVLNKVFIQRRPGAAQKVATGSQAQALDQSKSGAERENEIKQTGLHDDGNYTQFDLTVDTISVTLNLKRWLSGQGILETVEAKGIRGVVDRRYIKNDPNFDPTKHRKVHKRGDFDFLTTKIEDLSVTILQPNHQAIVTDPNGPPPALAPFEFSLFSCELPKLRKQWLLYDMLSANYVSGSFDNAMFSMHTRQLPTDVSVRAKRLTAPGNEEPSANGSDLDQGTSFKKVQRLRIDNVDIRHLNRGVTGMFGWIEKGSCDFLADIMLPHDDIELTRSEQFGDLLERWQAQVKHIWSNERPQQPLVTQVEQNIQRRESQKTVAINLRVQFNNPRASAPLYSPNLNYLNNAMIHPMVAYINSRDTYIPVHCYVAKRLYDFDGSWTVYDSGLMTDLSAELYRAFARTAQDDEERSRRIKKVGFWSLQFMAQLVLLTLGIVA